jgi:hypothetical protein
MTYGIAKWRLQGPAAQSFRYEGGGHHVNAPPPTVLERRALAQPVSPLDFGVRRAMIPAS